MGTYRQGDMVTILEGDTDTGIGDIVTFGECGNRDTGTHGGGDDVGCPHLASGMWSLVPFSELCLHPQCRVCRCAFFWRELDFLGGSGVPQHHPAPPPHPTVPLTWGPLCLPPPSPAPPRPHHSRRIQGPPMPPSPGCQSPHGGSTPGWKPPDPLLQIPQKWGLGESQ